MLAFLTKTADRFELSTRCLPYVYYALLVPALCAYALRNDLPGASLTVLFVLSLVVPVVLVSRLRIWLEPRLVERPPLASQARRQFLFDFSMYLLIASGLLLALLLWQAPPRLEGGKLLIGVFIIGYFASMDNALVRERNSFKLRQAAPETGDIRVFPVARRLGLFLTLTITVSLLATTVAAWEYIDRLAQHPARSLTDLRQGFAVDALAVGALVLILTLRLIYTYSVNLHLNFSSQIEVLRKVQTGQLDSYVPVVGHDEFTVVAQQINKMIDGLQEKKRVADTLQRIVSPSIMEKLLSADTDTLQLGQEHDLAILFCDLRDFTSFAEYAPPEEVIHFLNSYFSQLVSIVSDHNGIVNKFMGDAILAVYGLDSEANAVEDAVHTAWAIHDHVESLRRAGNSRLAIGVGIHCGPAVAGTIGSPDRYEYTFIGDAVNTASRLDGLTKRLGTEIIVSEDAYHRLGRRSQVRFEDLGWHRLRGKAEEIRVYGSGRARQRVAVG